MKVKIRGDDLKLPGRYTLAVIRAVCFDLGGVVVRIAYHWAEMLRRCGIPVPPHVREDDDLHAMPQFERYQASEIDDERYLGLLADYLGIEGREAARVHRSMLIEPFPGVLEIVESLNARGIVTGCLSNTNALHWEVLLTYPAIVAMQVRLASFVIEASKPADRSFQAFEEAAGVGAGEILLFDDSAANVRASRARGWSAALIDPHHDPSAQIQRALSHQELAWRN